MNRLENLVIRRDNNYYKLIETLIMQANINTEDQAPQLVTEAIESTAAEEVKEIKSPAEAVDKQDIRQYYIFTYSISQE